jgi:DNA repair protein RecO (recombination protein O)
MLVKTEVIVLRSMKYRDTSKIITFYSKEYGKFKGIAKGARSPKNKFGSALEPLSHSVLLLYKKEHRDLHLISQCDSVEPFRRISEELDRMYIGLSILELIDQVTHHEERSPAIFQLLIETLAALDASSKNYEMYLQAFQLRLAVLFGYAPNFETCGECGKPVLLGATEKQVVFQIVRGAVFCNECCAPHRSPAGLDDPDNSFLILSIQGLQLVRHHLSASLSLLSTFIYDEHVRNEIGELIRLYLRYHFDGFKPLKSLEFFQQQHLS